MGYLTIGFYLRVYPPPLKLLPLEWALSVLDILLTLLFLLLIESLFSSTLLFYNASLTSANTLVLLSAS